MYIVQLGLFSLRQAETNFSTHSLFEAFGTIECRLYFPPTPYLVKGLPHRLVSQLHAQEGGSIGRHSTSQGRAEAREERLEAAPAVQLADDAAERDVALGRLQARLDGVDGEDGDPHGDAGGGTGAGDGRQAQLARGLAGDGVLGAQRALDVLVGGEVGGGPGPVAGQGGRAAAENAAHAALAVELADDVEAAVVLGLLAGRELLLALDLEDDLDALKGRGDGRHGYGGQEAGRGDLPDGQALGPDGGRGRDDLLAEVVSPEGDGNCLRKKGERVSSSVPVLRARSNEGGNSHMGVTPTSGALTPAYSPLLRPSRATLFLTTSTADE